MNKTGGIIVEGAEQVGKSTFCRKLADHLGIPLVHMHKEYGFIDGKFDYFKSYFFDINATDEPMIFDRFYVSELAYGELFNRGNITSTIQDKIEARLRDLGYLVILLTPPDRKWVDREEMITSEQNKLVAKYFDKAFEGLSVTKMKLNAFEPESVDRAIEMYRRMP